MHLPEPERSWARLRHAEDYVSTQALFTRYVGFDTSQPPFNDTTVRRAFAHCVNTNMFAGKVMGGYDFAATGGLIPPGMPGHSPNIGLPYSPDQAKRLLAQAGYPNGRGFPVTYFYQSEFMSNALTHLQDQWQSILGVEIKGELLEYRQYVEMLHTEPPHIFGWGWVLNYPDPDDIMRASHHRKLTGWQNQHYDELVDAARTVQNSTERLRLYQTADHILIDNAPIIPLTYGRFNLLVKPWVKNFATITNAGRFLKHIILEPH